MPDGARPGARPPGWRVVYCDTGCEPGLSGGDGMRRPWTGALLAVATALLGGRAIAGIGVVAVTGGRVAGRAHNGVTAFKGIPFAAPPVGNLRWQVPHPVHPWTGLKRADRFAPSCMQAAKWMRIFGSPPAMSENCLYLNVWTPARSARSRLPVMVWIYGGGFNSGTTSAPAYNGATLARHGVVFVSLAYRLGPFGFLASPGLSREQHGRSGNYGLLDLIAGLKWVRRNIIHFGGDPADVTIFGQSAGGDAVSALVLSPLAKGLFERAICESGGGAFAPPKLGSAPGGWRPLALAEVAGQRFLARLGVSSLTAARALPASVIQKAASQGSWRPVFDGNVLPDDGYDLYEAGRFNDMPVLIGTNADEGRAFAPAGMTPARFVSRVHKAFGAYASRILAAYPHATDGAAEQAARDLIRDTTFAWNTWTWARLQSEKARAPAYLYEFNHHSAHELVGPAHGVELPFVFGHLRHPDIGRGLIGPPLPADLALSKLMMHYWVNFARTGNPNGPGLPRWPAFSASREKAMFLDAHPAAHRVASLPKLRAIGAYFAWRRREARAAR